MHDVIGEIDLCIITIRDIPDVVLVNKRLKTIAIIHLNTVHIAILHHDPMHRSVACTDIHIAIDVATHHGTTITTCVEEQVSGNMGAAVGIAGLRVVPYADDVQALGYLYVIANGETTTRQIYDTSISSSRDGLA